jgi:hypothetical protein
MPLPPQIAQIIEQGIDELIKDGNNLLPRMDADYKASYGFSDNSRDYSSPYVYKANSAEFFNIKSQFEALLTMLPDLNYAKKLTEQIRSLEYRLQEAEKLVGFMMAFKASYQRGWLESLINRIEINIAADYMSQAEALLGQGGNGQYDHVPAAVLAGAVLEENLRALCLRQNPPISVTYPRGDPKAMNQLIQDLQVNQVIDKTKAELLKYCAKIRNSAAHGHPQDFTKQDVENVLRAIQQFLASL